MTTRSRNHATWFEVRNVLVYAWSYEFFESLACSFGRLVCLDGPTSAGDRYDVARMLVDTSVPVSSVREIKVLLDGVLVKVTVEPDQISSVYPGIGLRSRRIKAVSLSSDESEIGEEGINVEEHGVSPVVTEKKNGHAR